MKCLVVNAGPGTGKTSTLEAGINKTFCGTDPDYDPSPQQLEIWGWMKENCEPGSDVLCMAFNKSIATELQERLSYGEAKTIHSLGASLLNPFLRRQGYRPKLDTWKTGNIFCDMFNARNVRALDKDTKEVLDDVKRAVSICKDFVVVPEDLTAQRLGELLFLRDYTPETNLKALHKYTKEVLVKGIEDDKRAGTFDFDDMIYMPNLFELKRKVDNIMVDEAQDLSYGRRALILNQTCDTYVFVGDTNQAVYAFAGADSESMATIAEETDATEMPLSVSYRCAKAIVTEAQQYLTKGDLVSAPNAAEGKVYENYSYDDAVKELKEGDLLLCRVNAPIVGLAWKLIKERKRACIVGRNLSANLKNIVKKSLRDDTPSLSVFLQRLSDWYSKQIEVQDSKKHDTTEAKVRITDQYDCIVILAGEADCVTEIPKMIKQIFADITDESSIRLASIHRAKGLEADRVFWYAPENTPHKMAKTVVAIAQEKNLQFVATTRAKRELFLVPAPKKTEVEV